MAGVVRFWLPPLFLVSTEDSRFARIESEELSAYHVSDLDAVLNRG
jgi:hypothetical protein